MPSDFQKLLSQFISINPHYSPLTDEFDTVGFLEDLYIFVKKNKSNSDADPSIEESGISAILELKDIYEYIMTAIEEIFVELNLDKISLAEEVIKLINFDYLNLEGRISNEMGNDSSTTPQNLSDAYNPELKNILGDTIDIRSAVDTLADVCNEVLNIIFSYDIDIDLMRPALDKSRKQYLLRMLQFLVNYLFVLKEAYEEIQYERSYIDKKNGTIRFKQLDENYKFLKKAGRERESNNILEFALMIQPGFLKKIDKVSEHINNGIVTFKIDNKKIDNPLSPFALSIGMTFFEHIEYQRIKSLNNLTVHEILDFLSKLQFIFHTHNSEHIVSHVVATQSIEHVPLKIERISLINTLLAITKLKKGQILDMLSTLSNTFSGNMNLWQSPLILHEGYYYICCPILQCDLTYWTELILSKFLDHDEQLFSLRENVVDRFSAINNNYQFNKVNINHFEQFGKKNSDALIYETKDFYIILEPCLIKFPLNSAEYKNAFIELAKTAETLNEIRAAILKENIVKGKEVILIIVPQYPTLSGFIINNAFVLDRSLLSNYFSTGEFKRGILAMDGNRKKASELSSIKYYSDEIEFNENFLAFCLLPEPIKNIISYYRSKEFPVGNGINFPKIVQESIDKISASDIVWSYTDEIEYLLRQEFYFEKSLNKSLKNKEKKYIEQRLIFLAAEVFRTIAFKKDERLDRLQILEVFKNVGTNGLAYLMLTLNNILSDIGKVKFNKTVSSLEKNYDNNKAQYLLTQILNNNVESFNDSSLSEIDIKHTMNDEEIDLLLTHIHFLLSDIKQTEYTDEDMNAYMLLITVYSALVVTHKGKDKDQHKIFLNFIDALNYNYQNQKAKNFSEEILEYSFRKHKLPTIGWLCLFRCFTRHSNIYDASFYGSMFLSCLQIDPSVDEDFVIESLYYMMIFYRDFEIFDTVKLIYDWVNDYNLSDYDKQRINFVYYSSKFKSAPFDGKHSLSQLISFLELNLDDIIKNGPSSIIPWISLLYNIETYGGGFALAVESSLAFILEKLEGQIEAEDSQYLKSQILPLETFTKQHFMKALAGVLAGVDYNDLSYELDKLLPLTRNTISLSLDPIDLNCILLSGLVINDQSLVFSPQVRIADKVPFIDNIQNKILNDLSSYAEKHLSELVLKEEQVLFWLFDFYEQVYLLTITHDKKYTLIEVENWNMVVMESWITKVSMFYFKDKGDFPINDQEAAYLQHLKELEFSVLPVDKKAGEILFYSSLRLSRLPHNLLQFRLSSSDFISQKHEHLIQDQIKVHGKDFISFNKPITNIISLEWFVKNRKTNSIPKADLSIEGWIPTGDEDMVLNIGYEKLLPIVEKYGGTIDCSSVPKVRPSSMISVFMAHGGKGGDGFKTLYTRQEEGVAFIKETAIDRLFGSGLIAVVFVCHSASISKNIYAQRLNSFVNEILSLGYKAVIAPAWGLHPDITPYWLDTFLNCFQNSMSISYAAFEANIFVAKNGYNEYHGFYDPTGWAAMHVFGNPNIVLE